MAICSFCERDNIGFMSGYSMSGVNGKICEECHSNLVKLRTSYDENTASYFNDIIQKSSNSDVIKFLSEEIPNQKINILSDDERKTFLENQNKEINSIILSTSDTINNYEIETYSDIVTGVSVLGTGIFSEFEASISDMFGTASSTMENKISIARNNALAMIRKEAHKIQCNAVIGVSLTFVPFTGNMIGLVATGTAVKIVAK